MPSGSTDPRFLTLHALRIKGFAKLDALSDLTALESEHVEVHLTALRDADLAAHREARGLWQLTPAGREHHADELAAEVVAHDLRSLGHVYEDFLPINNELKALCGDWQLRDGAPNPHDDEDYDRDVVERLGSLHLRTEPLLAAMSRAVARLSPYSPRLARTVAAVKAGDHRMFTGVMCGSYHDVWMELHEDLLLTQGLDRAAEGSF